MRFPHKARNEASFLVLFDIEATSVGVSISRYSKGTTSLLWYNRLDYSYKSESDYEHYERSMYATLLEVGMSLTTNGMRAAKETWPSLQPKDMRVVCVLAPPWFFGTVGTAKKEWEKSTAVTERVAEGLHKDILNTVASVPEAASWRTVVGDAQVLEHTYEYQTINGYPVSSYSGQNGTQASVTDYVAFIGSDVYGHITEILERVLPNHTAELRSSTSVLSDFFSATMGSGSHQGYLVEVGGHVTSVATLRNSTLYAVSTIPLGTHDLLSVVAPQAGSAEEARGKLVLLTKQTQQHGAGANIPAELEGPISEWQASVCAAFRAQGKGTVPYELVYLVTPKLWAQMFTAVLKRPWTMPSIRQEQTQKVTHISTMVEGPADPTVAKKPQDAESSGDARLKIFSHAVFYSMRTGHAIV